MKINKLFFASLAILATLVSCKDKEEPATAPSLSIDKTEVELGKEGGSTTITLTTNRDWTATTADKWITIEPAKGSASGEAQEVTITALPNTGNDRTGSVLFSIGVADKTIKVSQAGEAGAVQKGSGTEADPFNPADAIAKCIEVGETESTEEYYVKGIVSRIIEINITQYKNAKFYISADGSTNGEFYVYACSYLGGEAFVSEDQLKVGDEVVVKGKLVNYNGNTPEMTKGCYLVSINGESTGGDYLSVSFKAKTVASEAGSFTFNVTSNQDWTVSSDNAFATLSPDSGSGNGTVTVTYTKNEGETRTANITVKAASGEEKIVLTQYDKNTTPAVTLTWSKADWTGDNAVVTLEKDGYKITVDKQGGSTNPAVRENGCIRAYAKAVITIESAAEMQSIVFDLEDKFRTAEITSDNGTVAPQSVDDDVVSWTGNAKKVSFTVGEKAVYGSDGATKNGQLRFKSITIQQ